MINPTAKRMWDAGFSTLSPACLIDRFLDWVEQFGIALMMPAQTDSLSCREVRIETRRDQFGA